MGVTSLWTIVQPCARPIKIDTLNKKRLAIDASIWVYHFLKAVRDKEGNALRNSHVVGFYRRICKLLFFGIKPVFVFDGGAPALKRQTIIGRKQRREGRREDAVRTAGKLLAVQMQRRAEQEEQKRKDDLERPEHEEAEPELAPEDVVYADEVLMTEQERQRNRRFKKKDQYHLPDLNLPLSEMGQPNDPRVMSLEELQEYAKQFEAGEDINVYDFSKINFTSPFFTSLPATDRYNILNAARLRSRLRMGYSRDQLEAMFPDRMAFSRFQIDRVRERNELTQRLMQVGTVEDGTFGLDGNGRVAGEKGREYVLVKNPGVEGGWALGVIGESDPNEGQRSQPIDVEEIERKKQLQEEDLAKDEDLEDKDDPTDDVQKRREEFYRSRRVAAGRQSPPSQQLSKDAEVEDEDSLFVADPKAVSQGQISTSKAESEESEDEETQMQIAIAMSMQDPAAEKESQAPASINIKQKQAPVSAPFSSMRGSFASLANNRSRKEAPKRTVPVQNTREEDSSSDDENPMDLHGALAESRGSKYQPQSPAKSGSAVEQSKPSKQSTGPLPFEKLDLGISLLGKKKMNQIEEDKAGGFEKSDVAEPKRAAAPAPPWFSGDVERGIGQQRAQDAEDRRKDRQAAEQEDYEFRPLPNLSHQESSGPIDVDAMEDSPRPVFNVDSSDSEPDDKEPVHDVEVPAIDATIRMGDMADAVRAMPPVESSTPPRPTSPPVKEDDTAHTEPAEENHAEHFEQLSILSRQQEAPDTNGSTLPIATDNFSVEPAETDEEVEWSESDHEGARKALNGNAQAQEMEEHELLRSESPDDVYIPTEEALQSMVADDSPSRSRATPADESVLPASGMADQDLSPEPTMNPEALYSDPEDEELMQQLANEAEEHARFASSLNAHRTTLQNMADYEAELKSLRNQQKKDRRDADEVTHIMIQECQQLLKLFGLPYITAPMEAEAQCAELVRLGLVDGIVTDDSDIFLFGGTRVYKNMFNQAKFVECYLAADLTHDFDLTRNKLINIAHLLGSDYTEGLPGVGPVTALEILTEFPSDMRGLDEFRDWFIAIQQGTKDVDVSSTPFRRKFRKQATKILLPQSFPDRRVDAAYLKPEVDSDPSQFQWGVPDLDALRTFLMATIGWDQERTDEVLVPVIRDMNARERDGQQSNITEFLGGGSGGGGHSVGAGAFAPRLRGGGKSRRMESALERMAERARKRRKEDGLSVNGGVNADPVRDGEADAVIAHAGSAVDDSRNGNVASNIIGNGAKKQSGKRQKATKAAASRVEHDLDDADVDDDDDDESNDEYIGLKKAKGKRKGSTNTNKKGPRNKKKRVS